MPDYVHVFASAHPKKISTSYLYKMYTKLSIENILKVFLSTLLELQNVERGSIWVRNGDNYVCVEAMGDESKKTKGLSISIHNSSIVGWVIENACKTMCTAGEDDRHYKELEDNLKVKSKFILCYPLVLETGKVYGAVQLIETADSRKHMHIHKNSIKLTENIINICSIAISNFIAYDNQIKENINLTKALKRINEKDNVIIGTSKCFVEVLSKVKTYASVDFPVLITGESGTGKELIAREVHRLSKRSSAEYLIQNCSAIPEALLESELFGHKKGAFTGAIKDNEGLFSKANGGTVFLDEIGDMPYNLQSKLLRVLQNGEIKPVGSSETKKVNIRIIAATNVNLKEAVAKKMFRQDLFYRLCVLPVHLPPLRDRKEDIPILLNNFMIREAERLKIEPKRFSNKTLQHLVQHPWKGNIRELENFIRFIIVNIDDKTITPDDLPLEFTTKQGNEVESNNLPFFSTTDNNYHKDSTEKLSLLHYSWEELQLNYIHRLLKQYKWNVTKAAKHAKLNRSTFNSKMNKLGIHK